MTVTPSTAWCAVCDVARPVGACFSKNGFAIVECAACRFRWVLRSPSEEQLTDYYRGGVSGDYETYVRAGTMKKAYFRRKLKCLAPHLPAPGKLLDVGCAAGFLLEVAVEAGWDARGVELNPGFAASTSASVAERVTYGRLRDLDRNERRVLITLFDVLEHSPTARADLALCRDLLDDGGRLVAQLPCIDTLGARLLGSRWFHYEPPAHLSYFSSRTFEALARSLGLEIIHQTWAPKLMTLDYLVAQVARAHGNIHETPALPFFGKARLLVPMSERLFVLRRA
jgi:hypothetical protein